MHIILLILLNCISFFFPLCLFVYYLCVYSLFILLVHKLIKNCLHRVSHEDREYAQPVDLNEDPSKKTIKFEL